MDFTLIAREMLQPPWRSTFDGALGLDASTTRAFNIYLLRWRTQPAMKCQTKGWEEGQDLSCYSCRPDTGGRASTCRATPRRARRAHLSRRDQWDTGCEKEGVDSAASPLRRGRAGVAKTSSKSSTEASQMPGPAGAEGGAVARDRELSGTTCEIRFER